MAKFSKCFLCFFIITVAACSGSMGDKTKELEPVEQVDTLSTYRSWVFDVQFISWADDIVGEYGGNKSLDGRSIRIVTTFNKDSSGRIFGTYQFGSTPGILYNCAGGLSVSLRCDMRDSEGTGIFTAMFFDNFRGFSGSGRRSSNPNNYFSWSGLRKDWIESLDSQ